MGSRFFYLIIIALVGTGLYLKFFPKDSVFQNSPDKVASTEEWNSILTGDWNFKETIVSNDSAYVINGDVTYKNDSSFERFATILYYEHPDIDSKDMEFYDGYLKKTKGGKISGIWQIVNSNGWQETVKESVMDSTGLVNAHFPKDVILNFGKYNDDKIKTNIVTFNSDSIKIEGQNYSTGSNIYIVMAKKHQ